MIGQQDNDPQSTVADGDGAMFMGRGSLTRHLIGSGLELGPGHCPLPLPLPGVTVRYVDRWHPDENRTLFPELASEQGFPVPDIVANFDVDRLSAIPDSSEDFVICSHVLEHLAEPIGFLDEIHRVLRPGGVVLILLPDRRRTWDRDREPTSLDHLVTEFRSNVTEVDDDHILDFLRGTAKYLTDGYGLVESESPDPSYLDQHRRRSVHVHCWDNDEFLQVILFAIEQLNHQWDFVDGLLTEELGPENIEFGLVLRRTNANMDRVLLRRRFEDIWNSWKSARLSALGAVSHLTDESARLQIVIQDLDGRLKEATAHLQGTNLRLEAEQNQLTAIRDTKTFRYTARLRRAYAKVLGGTR
jgi:SAM-dependent methyltransferase